LLKEMGAPGPNAEDVFNRTRKGVARISNGEQVPAVFSSLIEDFHFPQPDRLTRQSARQLD
jgi:hypothetical protein